MAKPEISAAEKRMLEDLTAGFPALVRDLRTALDRANAIQLKLAAQASMFQAYGWPIPQAEGLTIQSGGQIPAAAHEALIKQLQTPPAPQGDAKVVEFKPAQMTTASTVERKSARNLVRAVLENGSELTVTELREVIKKKYGQVLAAPTVYRILSDRDMYANNSEGKWRFKK
jgi:hypothetical protein